ncbi:MAG: YggS family pyridoxal phosphate-dependent enzyme [Candidatus Izemoplasmatales bacterium]
MLNKDLDQLVKEVSPVKIVAATKYVDSSVMKDLLNHQITDFGENKVVDFLEKYEAIHDQRVTWHFIGHLQTNKVKKMINLIDYLHSLDRISLAEAIQKERHDVLDCFVEVNISGESSKTGLKIEEVTNFILNLEKYDKIRVVGLMGMAENTEDSTIIHQQFHRLYELKNTIHNLKLGYAPCEYLSMGMSHDYKIAILEHATHLRLGSILFRNEGE